MLDKNYIFVLAKNACDAFTQWAGKRARLQVRPAGDTGAADDTEAADDTGAPPTLVFRPKGGKADRFYTAIVVPQVDTPAIAPLIRDWHRNQKADENRVLLAPYIPAEQAKKLRDADIPFLDTAGNVYLAETGFFALVVGCPPPAGMKIGPPARPRQLLNPKGTKVLFVLLARPEYLNRPYRDIADAAGVALGTVNGVVANLKRTGYMVDLGKNGKQLLQRPALIEKWTAAYAEQLVPRHIVRRFRAETPDWWKKANLGAHNALWGGDVAADRMTGYLKPGEITLYAKSIPATLLREQRMRADPAGDVAVVEIFWNFPPTETEQDRVPPLLVYADLMATGDPRAIETAGLIHERYLA